MESRLAAKMLVFVISAFLYLPTAVSLVVVGLQVSVESPLSIVSAVEKAQLFMNWVLLELLALRLQ